MLNLSLGFMVWGRGQYHMTGTVRQFLSTADPWAATSRSHSSAHTAGHANRLQTMASWETKSIKTFYTSKKNQTVWW
jgi:hypothetical protein